MNNPSAGATCRAHATSATTPGEGGAKGNERQRQAEMRGIARSQERPPVGTQTFNPCTGNAKQGGAETREFAKCPLGTCAMCVQRASAFPATCECASALRRCVVHSPGTRPPPSPPWETRAVGAWPVPPPTTTAALASHLRLRGGPRGASRSPPTGPGPAQEDDIFMLPPERAHDPACSRVALRLPEALSPQWRKTPTANRFSHAPTSLGDSASPCAR